MMSTGTKTESFLNRKRKRRHQTNNIEFTAHKSHTFTPTTKTLQHKLYTNFLHYFFCLLTTSKQDNMSYGIYQ